MVIDQILLPRNDARTGGGKDRERIKRGPNGFSAEVQVRTREYASSPIA